MRNRQHINSGEPQTFPVPIFKNNACEYRSPALRLLPQGSVAQHLRQLRTLRTARIVHVVRKLLWAFCCKFIEPIDQIGVVLGFAFSN